jgi:prepilin-type N-terminal cleavage/methylation domain-containing protein
MTLSLIILPLVRPRRRPRGPSKTAGFTLIEVMVVVLIVGILAAAASLTLVHASRRASAQDLVRRIVELDQLTRRTAQRQQRRQQIVFDLDRGMIGSAEETSDGLAGSAAATDDSRWLQRLHVSGGLRLTGVRAAGSGDGEQDSGTVTLSCSTDGYTPTYALELEESSGPAVHRLWLVVAGLTGQVQQASEPRQVQAVWKMLGDEARDEGGRAQSADKVADDQ